MHLNITEKAGALGLLLERGFSESAARELRGIIDDSRLSPLDRASAAWVLSRHCYIGGRFDRALNLLETCDDLTSGGPKFAGQEESHIICLARLGRYGPARERLERLLEGVAADSPPAHLFFLYATVLRGQMLAAGAPLDEIEAVQLGHINRVLTAGGLAPLTKKNPEKPLALDNIQAPSAAPADLSAQPLVSVIMPAYNAAGTIQTGLEGLLAQTWTNLEIIVVDDASTDNTAGIVSQMARRDERLRLMQQPVNQGTYRARNRGVLEARGDLITVCDSDDWPHPQRTEILTRHLLNKPNLATVRGRWIRVGRHLETGRNWLPTAAFTSDPTSHIYRREMFEEIGPWDGIRIGADTELVDRVFRTYGPGTTEEINSPAPLLLSREYEGSLTRTGPTHLRTMAHAAGARFHYFKAYRHWHLKTLAAGKMASIPSTMPRPARKMGTSASLRPAKMRAVAGATGVST